MASSSGKVLAVDGYEDDVAIAQISQGSARLGLRTDMADTADAKRLRE